MAVIKSTNIIIDESTRDHKLLSRTKPSRTIKSCSHCFMSIANRVIYMLKSWSIKWTKALVIRHTTARFLTIMHFFPFSGEILLGRIMMATVWIAELAAGHCRFVHWRRYRKGDLRYPKKGLKVMNLNRSNLPLFWGLDGRMGGELHWTNAWRLLFLQITRIV